MHSLPQCGELTKKSLYSIMYNDIVNRINFYAMENAAIEMAKTQLSYTMRVLASFPLYRKAGREWMNKQCSLDRVLLFLGGTRYGSKSIEEVMIAA